MTGGIKLVFVFGWREINRPNECTPCFWLKELWTMGFPLFWVSLFFFQHAVWSVRLFSPSRGVSLHPFMPARIMVAVWHVQVQIKFS